MNIVQILFFSVFAMLPFPDTRIQAQECDNVQVSARITEDISGSKVTMNVDGGEAPYKYIFYKQSGGLLSEDFDSNAVTGLQKGKYFCTVIDKKNCKKTIEFEVK